MKRRHRGALDLFCESGVKMRDRARYSTVMPAIEAPRGFRGPGSVTSAELAARIYIASAYICWAAYQLHQGLTSGYGTPVTQIVTAGVVIGTITPEALRRRENDLVFALIVIGNALIVVASLVDAATDSISSGSYRASPDYGALILIASLGVAMTLLAGIVFELLRKTRVAWIWEKVDWNVRIHRPWIVNTSSIAAMSVVVMLLLGGIRFE